jgi:TetR/AcrR family transcriptional repressor of nem operon
LNICGIVSPSRVSILRREQARGKIESDLTFSTLVGAMSLARAVSDEALSREILKTVAGLLKHPA